MRKIDMNAMKIVHIGQEWPHHIPPHHKSMTPYLEKNERLVYWLQPEDAASSVDDQIPALKLSDGFYSLSLRIMKCIYRNIRLRKGFRNIETAQLGGYKLRIPKVLLSEKTRTQARFSTMRHSMAASRKDESTSGPQCKASVTAASKVTNVVFEFFLPVADRYFPRYTPFTVNPDVEEQEILEKISDVFPDCMTSKSTFVDTVGGIYDRCVVTRSAGSAETDPTPAQPAARGRKK